MNKLIIYSLLKATGMFKKEIMFTGKAPTWSNSNYKFSLLKKYFDTKDS